MRLLLPLAWIYDAATSLRNWLFDCGILPSRQFPVATIGIGNLAIGGTGKTPHTEMLVRMLLKKYDHLAILSRGYGRTTRGFRWVRPDDTASKVGDEPLQMRRKFPASSVVCAVCEDRCKGITTILAQHPEVQIVLLDDAFQHRYVHPDLNILLTDFSRTYAHDQLLPAGRLRESRRGAKRADLIIVTKCPPDLSKQASEDIRAQLHPHPGQEVFFSSIEYPSLPSVQHAVLVTGIARPEPLVQHLRASGIDVRHLPFADHHRFTPSERARIIEQAQAAPLLFTTAKDATRLDELDLPPHIRQRIYVIDITPQILFDQEKHFINTLYNYVSKNSRNRSVD